MGCEWNIQTVFLLGRGGPSSSPLLLECAHGGDESSWTTEMRATPYWWWRLWLEETGWLIINHHTFREHLCPGCYRKRSSFHLVWATVIWISLTLCYLCLWGFTFPSIPLSALPYLIDFGTLSPKTPLGMCLETSLLSHSQHLYSEEPTGKQNNHNDGTRAFWLWLHSIHQQAKMLAHLNPRLPHTRSQGHWRLWSKDVMRLVWGLHCHPFLHTAQDNFFWSWMAASVLSIMVLLQISFLLISCVDNNVDLLLFFPFLFFFVFFLYLSTSGSRLTHPRTFGEPQGGPDLNMPSLCKTRTTYFSGLLHN